MPFKRLFIQPKSLILIFIITALIVIISAFVELRQSKEEMLALMETQGHTLLESLLASSENALISYEKVENEIRSRLLNNAVIIRSMYEKGLVNNSLLNKIAEENKIYRINIFNNAGKKLYTSHKEIHSIPENNRDPEKFLKPIFDGELDTLIIGIKSARLEAGKRFAVAVSTPKRGAIVLNVDADELLNFRKQAGFGILIKKLTENKNIEYAALQNYEGILAASGNVDSLEDIDSSEVLKSVLNKNEYKWRIIAISNHEVFEGLHSFIHLGKVVGIFRLGLSMEPVNYINGRITRRIVFMGIFLIIFGFVTLSLIFVRQNFDVLTKRYKSIETYSEQIIDNANDGILVLDSQQKIKIINNAALEIVGIKQDEIINKELIQIFDDGNCRKILNDIYGLQQIECKLNGKSKTLLVSKSIFEDGENNTNTVLILKDLTDQILLEKQVQRKERLASMGELASSVAHEIRNPLNAIGTITQQLNKDFEPRENIEEYKSLSQLVYKEVKRINETVENFLQFAKPLPLKPEKFSSSDFFNQINKQYTSLLSQKNISLTIDEKWQGEVEWDRKQLQQVFINLFENAIDSIDKNGRIELSISEINADMLEIFIKDSGKGIQNDILNKIFNLYFTTKSKGSGIGLSVVQKIISEHNGIIFADNSANKGAVFTIRIPKYFI